MPRGRGLPSISLAGPVSALSMAGLFGCRRKLLLAGSTNNGSIVVTFIGGTASIVGPTILDGPTTHEPLTVIDLAGLQMIEEVTAIGEVVQFI